ncbi:unnamed protein product [Durusdinium trenchii]|uniref:Endonuclease/exonuclease/phosphatase domain-containing protein n=1 Tax=Durusdinium trenchii TaxID=1381693 RepID=A0ABP0PPW4_9DINO
MINDVPVVVSSFGTQLVSSSGGTSGFRAPSIGRSGGLAGVACGGLALVPLRCLLTLTQGRRVQRRRRRGRILFANPAVRNGTNHSPNARFDPGREALPPNFTSEVTVASWNILCPELCNPENFRHTNHKDLENETRFARVLEQLEQKIEQNAILCLQELSLVWCGRLHAFFHQRQYTFVTANYGIPKHDYMGVAVAFPSQVFLLEEAKIQKVADVLETIPHSEDQKDEAFNLSRGRRNQMISLRLRHRGFDKEFVVCTYHMPCAYEHMKVMVIHASICAKCAFEFAGDLPLVLAGDFNFRPGSAPYELLTTGKLKEDHEHRPVDVEGWSLWQECQLRSAYAEKHPQGEPPFTNYAWNKDEEPFVGTLDYIFVSKQTEVVSVERLPSSVTQGGHLPTEKEPSDHLLISATVLPFGTMDEPLSQPLWSQQPKGIMPVSPSASLRRPKQREDSFQGRQFGRSFSRSFTRRTDVEVDSG